MSFGALWNSVYCYVSVVAHVLIFHVFLYASVLCIVLYTFYVDNFLFLFIEMHVSSFVFGNSCFCFCFFFP